MTQTRIRERNDIMSQKQMRHCLVCGAEYEGCSFCDNQNEFLAWRSVVCKPEHFAYHIPIIAYVRKQMSKAEAKTELLKAEKEYGKIKYADNIKDVVAEIKANSKKKVSPQLDEIVVLHDELKSIRGKRAETSVLDEAAEITADEIKGFLTDSVE